MLPTDSIQIQDQLPVFSLGLGNIGIEIEKAGAEQAPARDPSSYCGTFCWEFLDRPLLFREVPVP